MRRKRLAVAMVLAGIGITAMLILLILGVASGSQSLVAGSATLGLLLLFLGVFVGYRIMKGWVAVLHELSTRVKNVETRASSLIQSFHTSLGSGDRDFSRFTNPPSGSADASAQLSSTLSGLRNRAEAFDADRRRMKLQLRGFHQQLKVLRSRVPAGFLEPVKIEIADIKEQNLELLRSSFEASVYLKRRPSEVLSENHARELFEHYLSRDELLQLLPLVESFELLAEQNLSTLRRLYRYYKRTGYWELAYIVIGTIHERTQLTGDEQAMVRLETEMEVFSRPDKIETPLPHGSAYNPVGPILHMVGRVLPYTQTGYTLRTQYTAASQARKGLSVAVVGQSGITDYEGETPHHYTYQDTDYYLLPGPARIDVLLDDWLRHNIQQLARLVLKLQPSVLHAQSDFFNALIVHAVGKHYGIPTVYESRGFWEDSWLSRTITANAWSDSESLFAMYGLPSAYEHRKNAEEIARQLPSHVFTLAEVMRDYILESGHGEITPESVTIVPNAVEPINFPVQERNEDLAAEIGIPDDAITIGYISSMVEYEGIDTLIDAYQQASREIARNVHLLLVGDGDYLTNLKERVDRNGIENVHFTGRVPHNEVLRYYGLIDIFVVPRKPSTVADLVTPLKPFEAFATGRAVILSDVLALREIAEQSGSVEVFQAGDPLDLSEKIVALAEDPARRAHLSSRASTWVRNHRTWDANVAKYYGVYKKLGYEGSASVTLEAELRLHTRNLNVGDLLDQFASLDPPPVSGWFATIGVTQSAQEILEEGWKYESFEPIPVGSGPDWASYGEIDRSWGFHLHTWKFLEPLLREFSATGQTFWLERAAEIAIDWITVNGDPEKCNDAMAWYDMSLSLRTPMLLHLFVQLAKIPQMRSGATILLDNLVTHAEKLEEEEAFNPNNNHGFFAAASQLHLAKFGSPIPGVETIRVQGSRRLDTMVDRQFAADGVHLEHSPDYHRMLLASFWKAINDGIIDDRNIVDRIVKASYVLGWMVQPDGRLVQFGDTPATFATIDNCTSVDERTVFMVSNGRKGRPPADEMAVFEAGGYAFVRSPMPHGPDDFSKSGYLAFSAAFHSRAHKHADDLNIVWFDQGSEILVDAGRYAYGDLLPQDSAMRSKGFYYSSPKRQYVEGTKAHNTLMIDGTDQERRDRIPYGSGIGECVVKEGIFDLSARARHTDYLHRRRLVYKPGSSLLIKDSVFSQTPETREAILWFNLDGAFELVESGDKLVFERAVDGNILQLEIEGPGTLIQPVRGQVEPMRGWRSREDRSLEPVWSVGFSFDIETRKSVETLFHLNTLEQN